MLKKRLVFAVLFTSIVSLSACVSKKQYLELQTKQLETWQELKELENKAKDMKFQLQETEEGKKECLEDLSRLKSQHEDLENKHVKLSQEAETLGTELKKRRSTIEEQKKIIQQLDVTKTNIEQGLKEEIEKQNVKLEQMEGKLKVTFVDKILFDQGSAEVKERGKELLSGIANSLKEDKSQNILVEGHTDNVPIGKVLKERFPSNWELSTARAAAVVRFFVEESGLDPGRLTASGYSHYRPVASNDTVEGRRENRRIEIILVPQR